MPKAVHLVECRDRRPGFRQVPLWAAAILIALAGVCFFGVRVYIRSQANRSLVSMVYGLGHIAPDPAALQRLIPRVRGELASRGWVDQCEDNIVPFLAGNQRALIIRSNRAGHDRVRALLRRLRTARDVDVSQDGFR